MYILTSSWMVSPSFVLSFAPYVIKLLPIVHLTILQIVKSSQKLNFPVVSMWTIWLVFVLNLYKRVKLLFSKLGRWELASDYENATRQRKLRKLPKKFRLREI